MSELGWWQASSSKISLNLDSFFFFFFSRKIVSFRDDIFEGKEDTFEEE